MHAVVLELLPLIRATCETRFCRFHALAPFYEQFRPKERYPGSPAPRSDRLRSTSYGKSPNIVSLLIEATKTFPLATSGTLNLVAKSNVSRAGTWSLL